MAARMTVEEVMLELEESDRSDGSENDSSESEDDFDGYLDEDIQSSDDQQCSSEEEQGSDGLSNSEEDQSSEDDVDLDIPSIPPYTLQPRFSAAINDSSPIAYFSLLRATGALPGHMPLRHSPSVSCCNVEGYNTHIRICHYMYRC